MSSRHTQSDENRPTLKTPRLRAGGWTPAPTPATPAPRTSKSKASVGKTPGLTPGETSKTPARPVKTPTAKSTASATTTTSTSMTASTTSTCTSTAASTSKPTRTPLRTPLRPRRAQQENPFAPTHDDAKGKGKRAADDTPAVSKRRALSAVGENAPAPATKGDKPTKRLVTPARTPSTSTSTSATATTPRRRTPATSTAKPPPQAQAQAQAQGKPRRPVPQRASTADILARPLGPNAYTTPAPGRRRKPLSGLSGLVSSRRISVRPDEPEAFEDVLAARGIDVAEIEGCAGGVADPPYDPPTPPRGREEEALYAVLEEPEIDLPDLPSSPHLDLPDLPDLDFVL